ncbi:DUF305 domain-containing protein [Sabulicella rubraurantiaca]|uniref:DUF305 domain-containing protein n=1 Tax=Sabulicella rubraurantiaca TaxID=2811429 RepID=UPI001A97735D|nr:DUF305 domain-containing protein [Sabulicella rubraurantiaca]
MRTTLLSVATILALVVSSPGHASVSEEYDPQDAAATLTWWDARILPRGAEPRVAFAAAIEADRDYVRGMRPHHAGALSMSETYLRDPAARNPALRSLARAIIVNQTHEIRLLDEVARLLDEPVTTASLGIARAAVRPIGTEGLANQWRYIRAPIPNLAYVGGEVGERDVRFAKAMIIHHSAALDMARRFNVNPQARNTFLALLNVDIVTDQSQEIALMRNIVAAYPGDADLVRIDPSEIHGMEGHREMGGHAAHTAPAPAHDHGMAQPRTERRFTSRRPAAVQGTQQHHH